MKVLGLDLSTSRTGYAVLTSEREIVVYGAMKAYKESNTPDKRIIQMATLVKKLISIHQPTLVIAEEAHLHHSTASTALNRLYGAVLHTCHQQGYELVTVTASEVKKIATGRGNADKPAMIAAANRLWKLDLNYVKPGYAHNQDDEADALFVACAGVDMILNGEAV